MLMLKFQIYSNKFKYKQWIAYFIHKHLESYTTYNLWHATYLKTIYKYDCNYKNYIYNYQAKVASFLNIVLLQNY